MGRHVSDDDTRQFVVSLRDLQRAYLVAASSDIDPVDAMWMTIAKDCASAPTVPKEMMMNDDLVKRLTSWGESEMLSKHFMGSISAKETCATAAAHIADLAAKLDEAQALIYAARQERNAAEDAEKELTSLRKAHEKEIAVWSENYAALERQLAEARAALSAYEGEK